MSIRHFYVPAPGQTDAAERAALLEVILVDTNLAEQIRYADRITLLPCVVCDHGDEIVVLPEPTTLEEIRTVHDALLEEHIPTTVTHAVGLAEAVATHTTRTDNPHNVTPATIGAAPAVHAHEGTPHNHIDADLPASIARDSEVVQVVSTHEAAANPHPVYVHSHPYAATSHSHADADLPAGLARDAEVAAAYSTLAHTHSYEASGAVAAHAGAADPHPTYLTAAEGGAAYSALSHTHTILDADIPATITRDAEAAAAYATIGHTHAATGISGGAIRKTANQTMTLTAQTAVTDMSFAVAANSTYYFAMTLRVTTSTGTSPTTAWGFTGPASPVAVAISAEQDTSTSVEVKGLLTAFGNLAAGAQVANTGAEFRGVVQTGAAAGTVQLTVARAGTTPSMVVAAGSNGYWIKVA